MRTNIFRISIGLLIALFWHSSHAEPCTAGARAQTTPMERFTLNANGTVLDKTTGLTWMRCALGQTWDGKTCVGSAKHYAWQDTEWAKDALNFDGYAGYSDWRVPVVPELASIVELGCANARINTTVFPETPSGLFWSSMEKPGTRDYAYTLDFGAGGAAAALKTTPGVVRLVRGGPWWTPPKTSTVNSR